MANHKVPQAYRPDPGQLVMVSEQNTVAETKTGSRMIWVGAVIGGAFIAAACLWTVNGMLQKSVEDMEKGNSGLDSVVQEAEREIAIFEARASFFAAQKPRLEARNQALEAAIRQPSPRPPPPPAPQRGVPPP